MNIQGFPSPTYDGSDWHMGRSEGIKECSSVLVVVGWCIKELPNNLTNDPALCAYWHRCLFNVVPVFMVKDQVEG